MSTHALPRGTCNFPVNMPVEFRRELGRMATIEHAPSVGAWVREVIEERIAQAKARGVEVLRDARQLVLPLGCVLVIGIGLGCLAAAMLAGDQDAIARAARRGGRRRDEIEFSQEAAEATEGLA